MADIEKPTPQPKSESSNNGFKVVSYESNQVIFEEGAPGDAAYLITKGSVEIRKGTKSSNPQTLAHLGVNDIFGEMALFDNAPRMAEAIARSPVDLVAITHDEFHRRLSSIDPVIRSITTYLVSRVRNMADEFQRRKDPDWGKWKKD